MPIQASCVEEYVCRTSLVMTITSMCQSVCCVSKILARQPEGWLIDVVAHISPAHVVICAD